MPSRALQDVTVVVMPSTWDEPASLAAIEQMMHGRLVIVADIGGLAEVLGDTGLNFPPGNTISLANCLRRVIENPSGLAHMVKGRAAGLYKCFNVLRC